MPYTRLFKSCSNTSIVLNALYGVNLYFSKMKNKLTWDDDSDDYIPAEELMDYDDDDE